MYELITGTWPWFVAGPLIGLTVFLLKFLGNKSLGISSAYRHICAACAPRNISFLNYNWKKESWNLIFVFGVALGGFIGIHLLDHPEYIAISQQTVKDLNQLGISHNKGFLPDELFSLMTIDWKLILFMIAGGFLVGFGTRYAGGCTSGHAITGLANLQKASLIAVISFFAGGLFVTWVVYPFIF
jgi:uncharacterized protein